MSGDSWTEEGLSPHARGNLPLILAIPKFARSIPARAGKPPSRGSSRFLLWVYPRTRGETALLDDTEFALEGLSPHARGNRRFGAGVLIRRGSIPARAGKPQRRQSASRLARVYPRTRGETASSHCVRTRPTGLSPHARGNRWRRSRFRRRSGSIPARAGKPGLSVAAREASRVYPRTRGETAGAQGCPRSPTGLSPHARGNPESPSASPTRPGSIPARAGKPVSRTIRCRA